MVGRNLRPLAFFIKKRNNVKMNIERNLVIVLLKLTRGGPVSHELINKEAKTPSRIVSKLLEKLQNDGLVYVHKSFVETDIMQRLRLAVHAINLGADPEQTSRFLQWKEFEGMAAFVLEQNRYSVMKNLRFKHGGRRWEVDIVGCKKPSAICIDCKHWNQGVHPSALKKIVQEQVKRTQALAKSLPNPTVKIECATWDKAKLIPVVLSLTTPRFRFYEDVPIVSVLQLQDFLNQLPAYTDSLFHVNLEIRTKF
jgi:Holliday junction resolvase-like predicted endonuclease